MSRSAAARAWSTVSVSQTLVFKFSGTQRSALRVPAAHVLEIDVIVGHANDPSGSGGSTEENITHSVLGQNAGGENVHSVVWLQ